MCIFLYVSSCSRPISKKLAFKPFVKPTSQKVPLCSESCHHPSVHKSWPIAYASRLAKRASSRELVADAHTSFINWLGKNTTNPNLVRELADFPPSCSSNRDPRLWITVPFQHGVRTERLRAAMQSLESKWSDVLRPFLSCNLRLGISWRNAHKNALQRSREFIRRL